MSSSVSQEIDSIIAAQESWKRELLTELRQVIQRADPALVEEIKWKMPSRPEGLPVWSHDGILCFAEIWKDNVKLLFPKGAQLSDPNGLFNARLKSRTDRAIEFRQEDPTINIADLKNLIAEAVRINTSKH